jgi:hypothetical protein
VRPIPAGWRQGQPMSATPCGFGLSTYRGKRWWRSDKATDAGRLGRRDGQPTPGPDEGFLHRVVDVVRRGQHAVAVSGELPAERLYFLEGGRLGSYDWAHGLVLPHPPDASEPDREVGEPRPKTHTHSHGRLSSRAPPGYVQAGGPDDNVPNHAVKTPPNDAGHMSQSGCGAIFGAPSGPRVVTRGTGRSPSMA